VDGFLNWGHGGNGTHLGTEHDQVILSCENLYTKNVIENQLLLSDIIKEQYC